MNVVCDKCDYIYILKFVFCDGIGIHLYDEMYKRKTEWQAS